MADRLRALPRDLYLDSGDCIKAGNLASPLRPEVAWDLLKRAGCDVGTLGNRETHPIQSAFEAKMAGKSHRIVCSNMFRRDGSPVFPASMQVQCDGLRVGIVGAMVPMVTRRMATQAASGFLWEDPIVCVRREAESIRAQVDCLIALTHIGFSQDQRLAEACPLIDIIFGGHSHTILNEPERIGKVWICQGGSHGRLVGRYVWAAGELLEAQLLPLTAF